MTANINWQGIGQLGLTVGLVAAVVVAVVLVAALWNWLKSKKGGRVFAIIALAAIAFLSFRAWNVSGRSSLLSPVVRSVSFVGGTPIDTRQARVHTGLFVEAGKYRIQFGGGWNLNTANRNPPNPVDQLMIPDGVSHWPLSKDFTFPQLRPMSTGLSIGTAIVQASQDFEITVTPDWLNGSAKTEVVVLINDVRGGFGDNGPGVTAAGETVPYTIKIEPLEPDSGAKIKKV